MSDLAHSEIPEVPAEKTWKRETAWTMLVFLAGLYLYGLYDSASNAFQTAESLKNEIFLFVGGAFAMDAYAKQIRR